MIDLIALTAATRKAQHEMTVCNACRYCEAYCPVFQAMEERTVFSPGDITYLANLCHNCGECLYACQYAPPHEFGIDVPRTMSELRVESYEAMAWPAAAARAFRHPWLTMLVSLVISIMVTTALARSGATFYDVISHDRMVTLFGVVGLFAITAIAIGHRRFGAAIRGAGVNSQSPKPKAQSPIPGIGIPVPESRIPNPGSRIAAATDALTLRHLHATGEDCVDAEETRRPWRRWMHHCTFYGFLLCFASTTVAAIYHVAFGWIAPYGYSSAPVLLGAVGGVGLLIGPAGLFLVDRGRDAALTHSAQRALDGPFLAMLFATSLTGLLLLALRAQSSMPALLSIHLAFVLALFVTLPYGKFVHGIYRAAALVKFRREERN